MEKFFERHEREIAEWLPAGSQTIASGAVGDKRDVQQDQTDTNKWWRFLVDAKSTQQKGYRVTAKEWEQLERDVLDRSSEMRPALALRFYGLSKGTRETTVLADLAVISFHDLSELLTELDSLRSSAAT